VNFDSTPLETASSDDAAGLKALATPNGRVPLRADAEADGPRTLHG